MYATVNVTIGLTNVHPLAVNPTLDNYVMCGQYLGTVETGATVSIQCTTDNLRSARYVIVQIPSTDNISLCEVEVYTHQS